MISEKQWTIYEEARAKGLNQTKAARLASISIASAKRHDTQHPDRAEYAKSLRLTRNQPDPRRPTQLPKEAQRALEDFNYFQLRYLGRIGLPWQEIAAHQVRELLTSQDKEYVVINAPPGAGKSSLFTYAIPLWLTCQDRAIRGLVGSATARLGAQYTALIRKALEATIPLEADGEDLAKGIAVDAVATLSEDFGRFKPTDHDSWTKDAFIVQQMDGASIRSKEPTWTAVGRDQEFIGGRYDFCIWDDLVTPNRLRSIETIEKDRDWWDTYAERRLEPGGLLILQGQRMGANDLYRYCLDMEVSEEDDEDELEDDEVALRETTDGVKHKYHHINFKAHYEELCKGKETHKRNAPAYPDGCLLSPRRIQWREISSAMKNRPDKYAQVYQQEDVSSDAVLVDPAWISGIGGWPGCWDKERDRLEVPHGLMAPTYSIVSVDPSPTRYWAIEWWLYNEPSDQWFLIDLLRTGLDAPDLLDWNANMGVFSGIMEDWQAMSRDLGIPITHWIIEQNGAQRFLLKYDHVHRWQSKNSVQIIPHDTYRNKTNDDYGVQMIAPNFKFGRVRLPGKVSSHKGVGLGRAYAMKLVDEVTRYSTTSESKGTTDDCVMACWFAMYNIQYIHRKTQGRVVASKRPSWVSGRRPLQRTG
jgi:hypothetical protein